MTELENSFFKRIKDYSNDYLCWEWIGSKDRQKYGLLSVSGFGKTSLWLAHRVSYILHKGLIPIGKLICHHCDNPSCVNPNHLYAGTHADNSADMVRRGRHIQQVRKKKRLPILLEIIENLKKLNKE